MSKSFIYFTSGKKSVVEPQVGLNLWNCLHGVTEPSKEQAAILPHVKSVFLPPSIRTPEYLQAHSATLTAIQTNAAKKHTVAAVQTSQDILDDRYK